MALPANSSPINTSDTISDTIKTTAGYFTNGDGTLSGDVTHTGSLSDSNELYYFNVVQTHPNSSSAEVQLAVAYGDARGSGSNTLGDTSANPNTLNGETEAIYKQFANLLLEETEASGGFKISANAGGNGVKAAGIRDDYIYILIGKRDKFKDRINKKAWTLSLSGSNANTSGSDILTLTDDSEQVAATATPGGPRYNIVSGALGVPTGSSAASHRTFGWFWPEMGTMVFSGVELSKSIAGPTGSILENDLWDTGTVTASFATYGGADVACEPLGGAIRHSSSGFHPNLTNKGNAKNALRLVNCMTNMGSSNALRLRSEEDQTQENYFCRIKATEYNFSANPTFVSGSKNKIRNLDMHGNPQTFITGVGLYNSAGQLLAIAKLSSPLKKNFASEATIKVKLTY